MIRLIGIVVTLAVAVTSCGRSDKSRGPAGPHKDDPGGESQIPGGRLTSSGKYLDLVGPDGEHLSKDTFPSMYKGKDPVPACEKGESYFGDTCWSRLELSDTGRIYLGGHGERRVKSGLTMVESFSLVEKDENISIYMPQKTFQCDFAYSGCQSPNLLRHGVRMRGESKLDIAGVTIPLLLQSGLTHHNDGIVTAKLVHSWWLDGSFTLRDQKFALPLRVKDVMEAYGDDVKDIDRSLIHVELGEAGLGLYFWYETETTQHAYETDNLSPDIEDRRIIETKFYSESMNAKRRIKILLENNGKKKE